MTASMFDKIVSTPLLEPRGCEPRGCCPLYFVLGVKYKILPVSPEYV